MNKANLKSYAPKARLDFIKAVTARANVLGISVSGALPAEVRGAVAIIDGREWPAKVSAQRDQLIERIRKDGFAHTMEAVAYTWFNRFAALRYMELHDYLGHGHRALSSTSGGLPDILTHATDLTNELPGLNAAKVIELKLAGNRDGELYRMLLVAQCNALSHAMPFLFERIDDDSELLLPDNLLRTDSIIAQLVNAIDEDDWKEVEIIGWLYQFYISEKKDQVIGKVVKSEDIPAATQLFTPNWIVQYLVQNSVGRLWLMANPQSLLAQEWPYYITPAEQTPEVQAQLDALIQTRVREDGDTLNPEAITVLDPACGSGHILVVAYDVLKAIYLERGYQPRAIPRLILEKNLYGLDIDDRAAQMAGFALLMKARADDRRLFTSTDEAGNLQPPKLNVLSLQESKGLSVDELATHLAPFKVQRATITALVETFEHAKTFGSLIQIPYALKTHLAVLPQVLALVKQSGDMYASAAADDLLPLVQQAQVLAMQFDAVVANPPYMGSGYFEPLLKKWLDKAYKTTRTDLYAIFMERSFDFLKIQGVFSMVTMQAWMFTSSYIELRNMLITRYSISNLAQLGSKAFDSISGEIVSTAMFSVFKKKIDGICGVFTRLVDGASLEKREALLAGGSNHMFAQNNFSRVPNAPFVYWKGMGLVSIFENMKPASDFGLFREGLHTGDNEQFVRRWWEVSFVTTFINAGDIEELNDSGAKWVPYNKGGGCVRWYGNYEYVVAYDEISRNKMAQLSGHVRPSQSLYFKEGGTWSDIGTKGFGIKYYPQGFVFDAKGPVCVSSQIQPLLAALNSLPFTYLAEILMPTVSYKCGTVKTIPIPNEFYTQAVSDISELAIELARDNERYIESAWEYIGNPISGMSELTGLIANSFEKYEQRCSQRVSELMQLETENNRFFINAYDLQDELSPEVPESQITLARADREKDSQRLISYAIGCMMGRYSLDEPGLIYAHAGNVGFDSSRYIKFPSDADGIVPITDELWFADDACSRIREFLRAVWGPDTLEENMAWLAESLGTKASETPDETIRRYIADKFFKDHLQTYKKRPIYWLFSSGKQGAFQALVYLHRYHEGTLARLRAEYVVPLIAKVVSRLDMLGQDVAAASSAAARTKLLKQIEGLRKKQIELLAYDEKLRHYADMRITLDLDDGVKVNYSKFGDLLEGVKIVTGGASDD